MTNLYDDYEKKAIGQRIKNVRKQLQLTLKEFGELFDPVASDSIVSRWERGISIPNDERLNKIAELGKVTPSYLISGHFIDLLSPEQIDEYYENEFYHQTVQEHIKEFKEEKYVQLEDFINPINPRYFFVNGHKLEQEEIEMLIKLFEGKEKNYPSDKEIEEEYNTLRDDYLNYLAKKEKNPKMLYFGESTNYKYHK